MFQILVSDGVYLLSRDLPGRLSAKGIKRKILKHSYNTLTIKHVFHKKKSRKFFTIKTQNKFTKY